MRVRLIESIEAGPEVRRFFFEASEMERLDFTPGQFVSLREQVHGRPVTRAYSIASTPSGNRFELCLNRVREGLLSPWLFQMKPGDRVEMLGPLGYFVPKVPFRDAVLVATGTGIAPFRAYLNWPAVIASGCRITLLYGARFEPGLIYREEFEALQTRRAGFTFLPCLTRPGDDWRGRVGRVQQHLDEALDGRTDVDIYICGLRAMVDSVREILKAKGFPRQQIIAERYD